jgi:hypothetical protein
VSNNRKKKSSIELLLDPTVLTVSLTQAAKILGISPSTALKYVRQTGQLSPDIPVIELGDYTRDRKSRRFVPMGHLRTALGIKLKQIAND